MFQLVRWAEAKKSGKSPNERAGWHHDTGITVVGAV